MAACKVEYEADLPLPARERSAFNFENVTRNIRLETDSGVQVPKARKTGTTICGVVFKGGVVLGADTRATEGTIVADKNCEKIHYIAPNIYCCGAGTSADTENVTSMVASSLALQRLTMGKQSRVLAAQTILKRHLFRYQGHVSAALVLGGVDVNGPYLSTVAPHGSTDRLPFVTMGSGSLAAMSVFEAEYKDDLTEKEAIDLVHKAISRGIFEDLGSGSNVDIRVVRKDGTDYHRGYDKPNERAFRKPKPYVYPPGSVIVLKETVKQLDSDAMQTD
jgi:20S proteasome subunit beta 2|uniref:Proteasome subunit beta n=1 Tax=Eutreptiella gymnastica TaxID=73025 RepID=A0A7S4FNN6_9EUGL|eukprot:CAMPEP_0174283152 /NCGR_PEP_ID=MMETSP0809-20121228/3778_1 /TAXON_ID=73025 ORGANISM="Eutreptiella gymnastica-like, Strain CCMP1594" /NCGR_SAMPLE_ID=MMETSP0809 /ASSEMBLY_ACC=CAM_ASM_000658 /LENGTH=276 /DNA_ID=CAMNT_0015377863 /DNA_START=22 /DNA_END=852 /DNA_ORIENTATION=-